MRSYPPESVVKFLNLALKCSKDETNARTSMTKVDRELGNIWHMMPNSNIWSTSTMATNAKKVATPPSLSSMVKDPYVSSEIFSIELVNRWSAKNVLTHCDRSTNYLAKLIN